MIRRDFLAHLGAATVVLPLFVRFDLDRVPDTLIGPLGKWAESIALAMSNRVPALRIVTSDRLVSSADLPDAKVILLGALGGRTGLEAAKAYAEISRMNKIHMSGITLVPGSWEGRRRLDVAEAALGTLASGGIRTEVVNVHVGEDRTLREWGAVRRTALENRLLDELV